MTVSAEIVPVSRSQKIVLREKPLREVAETLVAIPVEEAPEEFPELPEAINAPKEIRAAMLSLTKLFQSVVLDERRSLTDEELSQIGPEYEALQKVSKYVKVREEAIKEALRTHQDVEAEEAGIAFPKDVVHNGNVVAHATPRDAKGHYILAKKGDSRDTEIPGTTLRFANQFVSGKTTEDLNRLTAAYEAGEISEDVWKQLTEVRRVPTAEKVKAYVLKTGETWPLVRAIKKGRDSSAMYLRALKSKK